jgi:arylsulfatase A-like enzyme
LLGEGEQKQHDVLYWAFYERGGARAVRMGKWKAVEQPLGTPVQLFDLEADLGEQKNLAEAHPAVVAEARRRMAAADTPSERWRFPAKPARQP